MGEVHCRNPKTGIVYVYSSQSYWSKEDKKTKARRKLIGKLDENGNVVPTNGHPGRPRKSPAPETGDRTAEEALKELKASYEQRLKAQEERILQLESSVRELTREKTNLVESMDRVLSRYRSA